MVTLYVDAKGPTNVASRVLEATPTPPIILT